MVEDYAKHEKYRSPSIYPLGGFLLGCLFVLAAYGIEIAFLAYIPLEKTFWHVYLFMHAINPVLYLTDMAPFVLAAAGALAGRKHAENTRYLKELQILLKDRSARLKTASQRYGKLFARIDDSLLETDMSGNIRDMNPAGIKALQLRESFGMKNESREEILEEMRRRKITAANLYEEPADRKRLLSILSKKGRVTNFQLRGKRLDGDVFDAVVDAFLDYDEKGNPIFLARIIDLSSIKQAQYLLQETNSLLEKKNNELSMTVAELQALKERYQQRSGELDKLNSELKKTNRKLKELAITDGLTGLYNHRHLMELFKREWERSKRNRRGLCFLMMDVDYFKGFNDTWGHQAGDRVLRLVADTIKTQTRKYDITARYGGEEFAVVLPETGTTTCYAIASRIRKTVEEMDLSLEKNGKKGKVTISIGLTEYLPEEGDPRLVDQLLQDADSGLYLAKSKGRNRVEGYKRDFSIDNEVFPPLPEKKK